MKLRRISSPFQHPDLFEWAGEQERSQVALCVGWIARRCRVSRSTAAVIAENAGLLKGDR